MPKVRTTFRPDREVEVSEHEESVLRAYPNNVVLDTKATTDEGARRAAERQAAKAAENQES